MTKDELKALAATVAQNFGFPVSLVQAICQVESSWEPGATRFEKNYQWLYKPESFVWSGNDLKTETQFQKTSLGLMQLMGAATRERGFTGNLPDLLTNPALSLHYSCEHLLWMQEHHGEDGWQGIVRAWNTGRNEETPAGLAYQTKINKALGGAWPGSETSPRI